MLPSEVESVIAYAAELWPNWDPTPAELGLWRQQLGQRSADTGMMRTAVGNARVGSRFKSPQLADIYASFRELPGQEVREIQADVNVLSGVWCVRLGTKHAVPLVYHRDRMPPIGALLDIARAMIDGNEREPGLREVYPGEWFVVQDAKTAAEALGAVA